VGVTGGTGLALALVLGTTWMVLRSDALSLKNGKQLCFALVLVALGTAATTAVHRCTPLSPWFALRWFNTSAGRVVRKPAHCSQPSSVTFSQGWRDVCAGRLPQRAVPHPTAADFERRGCVCGCSAGGDSGCSLLLWALFCGTQWTAAHSAAHSGTLASALTPARSYLFHAALGLALPAVVGYMPFVVPSGYPP
jgi:hypothetical protein